MKTKKGILIAILAALGTAFGVVWVVTTWLHSNPFTTSQEVGYVLVVKSYSENPGMYTINQGEIDNVLVFESQRDAIQYSIKLQEQGLPLFSTETHYVDSLFKMCEDPRLECIKIPRGSDIVPPTETLPLDEKFK